MRMHNKTLKARIVALPLPRAGGAALRPPLHLPPYGGGGAAACPALDPALALFLTSMACARAASARSIALCSLSEIA